MRMRAVNTNCIFQTTFVDPTRSFGVSLPLPVLRACVHGSHLNTCSLGGLFMCLPESGLR